MADVSEALVVIFEEFGLWLLLAPVFPPFFFIDMMDEMTSIFVNKSKGVEWSLIYLNIAPCNDFLLLILRVFQKHGT